MGTALIDYAILLGCSAFLVIAGSAITSKAEQRFTCVAYNLNGGGTEQLGDFPPGENPCAVPAPDPEY